MKKILAASFLSAIFCGGGVNSLYAAVNDELTDEPSTNTEEKTDVTIGDDTNGATLSWSDTTLTVTGKGDLSKITITEGETSKTLATKLADYIGTGENASKKVVFKTKDGETELAKIDNSIVRNLISSSITALNLQGVYLDSIKTPLPKAGSGDWTIDNSATFMQDGNQSGTANSTLKILYTPQTKSGSALKPYSFIKMSGLVELHLSEGIDTLESLSMQVENNGFGTKLTTLTFPNSLKVAKTEACKGLEHINVFTFPAGMAEIDSAAFMGTNPSDVYFLGLEAPKVARNAWGDNSYISNNSLTLDAKTTVSDGGKIGLEVDLAQGVATRSSYKTKNGWMTMLHYPAKCTKEQAAKYTDITRTYVKIDYGTKTDLVKDTTINSVTVYAYTPGKETKELKGVTQSTSSNVALKTFFNRFSNGTHFGNDYTGGYNDIFVGSQYIWPSMVMAYRATVVAQNNVLWDGVTSIADGIKNAAKAAGTESTYSGDGKEYIGLHQFVFAQGDVTTDKTDEWDVTKYADGEWHSICLPFDVTKKMMKETFGPNKDGEYKFRVCKFHKVDRTEEKLKLYFNDEYFENAQDNDVVMNAHVSYMIKAKKENMVQDEKVVIKNYVMVAGSPLPTNVTVNASDTQTLSDEESGDEGVDPQAANQYFFIGNYTSGITIPQYSYFFSKTKKYFRFQAGTTAKWNGYTSVVEAPNGKEDYEKYFNGTTDSDAKLSTVWDDSETTDINKVTIEIDNEIVYTNDNVYNLNGQLVSTRGLNGLSKGIYIQNGKKYIVK